MYVEKGTRKEKKGLIPTRSGGDTDIISCLSFQMFRDSDTISCLSKDQIFNKVRVRTFFIVKKDKSFFLTHLRVFRSFYPLCIL